jgi:PKD repeat protein
MDGFARWSYALSVILVLLILVVPAMAYTTEVTVRRYAVDGLTPVTETTRDYHWMEDNLPVYGDGNTFYYYQGPVFENEWEANYGLMFPEYRSDWGGTPPSWLDSEEKWDRIWDGSAYVQKEETNWQVKNLGKLKGTNIRDLCDLVGGLSEGQRARIIATDNVDQYIPYAALYENTTQLGPYVLTWYSVGAGESGTTSGYTGPDYPAGMRATFFSDTSRNENGEHVAGLGDQAEGLPEESWYYYGGEYPSMGGWTLKYVDRVYIYSNDPVPLPDADFAANTRTGHILNGNFETGVLTPWTGSGATVSNTYTYKKDLYSVRLVASASGSAWIRQDVDMTNVGTIHFWRHSFSGAGKYMEVLVDDTIVANYTETITVPNDDESIDITAYGFVGTHTIKFNAVNSNPSGVFTIYLDNIEDYGPGTSGDAPLTVQFTDLSTKMEDTAHSSWAWDFQNDGSTDSTSQDPLFTYTADGTYTVKLTATNAAGSNTEIRTGYITVGTISAPTAAFTSATPRNGTAPLNVQFSDQSTGEPASWAWAYRNSTTGWTQFATTPNPAFTFCGGSYDINLTVTNAGGSDEEIKSGYVNVVVPLQGQTDPPTDPDGDGLYEDLNRTGELDFDDVVVFFKNIEWIMENEPVAAFDFNGSGTVGFEDVVQLFKEV